MIRTHEAEASDLQSDGFGHLPTLPYWSIGQDSDLRITRLQLAPLSHLGTDAWRRVRDSNPGGAFAPAGFLDQLFKPTHTTLRILVVLMRIELIHPCGYTPLKRMRLPVPPQDLIIQGIKKVINIFL